MRLAADIALLDRAAGIATAAISPPAANLTVPAATLRDLETELNAARQAGAEYWLIGDAAVLLMIAARQVVNHRDDGDELLIERWTRIAELLRQAVAADLDAARKSLAALS